MIRHLNEQIPEYKHHMRDGEGTVTVNTIWNPETELKAPQRLFARLVLPPGASIGEHPHINEEEVYYVISGEGETTMDGKVIPLKTGDSTLTGNGASHSVKNTGDIDLEILAVITLYPAVN